MRPSRAANITVWPVRRSSSARPRSSATSTRELDHQRGVAERARRGRRRCRAHAEARARREALRERRARCRARRRPRARPPRAGARCRVRAPRRSATAPLRSTPLRCEHRDERWLALGERAGLVHEQRVHLRKRLERLGVAEQHAGARAAAGRHHDRHRRREPERARAGDDQHRDGGDERVRDARLGPEAPTKRWLRSRPPPRPRERTTRATASAKRWIGARRALRVGDERRRCARAACLGRRRRRASRTCPRRSACRPSREAPRAFATGIGSPVSIDSSTALSPSSTPPSTGIASPGRTRRRFAGATLFERNVFVAVVRHAARRLRREPSSARIASPVRARARSSSTWPSSTSVTITAAASK